MLRSQYRRKRQDIAPELALKAAQSLFNHFMKSVDLSRNIAISGYLPIDGEIDVLPILEHLSDDHNVLIPVNNEAGKFQNLNQESAVLVVPEVVITPLIAFDLLGYRLGFGGGWYDQAIASLRPQGTFFIGVGYEFQRHSCNLPTAIHDMKLDMIITDCAAYNFFKDL